MDLQRRNYDNRQIERVTPKLETRADGKKWITGYAAVFYNPDDPGTEFRMWSNVYERVRRECFDRALKEDDPAATWNHNSDINLGRKSAGTLILRTDSFGLWYEFNPPDTEAGRSAIVAIERRDVNASSFAFLYRAGGDTWSQEEGKEVNWLGDVTLMDVSPVTYESYTSTSTAVTKRSLESWKQSRDDAEKTAAARVRRLRLARARSGSLAD